MEVCSTFKYCTCKYNFEIAMYVVAAYPRPLDLVQIAVQRKE